MKVGLMRHFPVSEPLPRGWMTIHELLEWRRRYDSAQVVPRKVDLDHSAWLQCWCSDLERAQTTARTVFAGAIHTLPELREVEFAPFETGKLRLPVIVWRMMIRMAWATGHGSQRLMRDDFMRRVRDVADRVESQSTSLLIVSHAGVMIYLRRELLRRGFVGPRFGIADHAQVYAFQKQG